MNQKRRNYRSTIGSILPIIVILGLFFNAFAADSGDIVKEIQKSFEELKNLQADYQVEYIAYGAAEPITESGKLIWAGENRFRTETPDQTIVCDGTTLWMFSSEHNQVILRSVSDGMNDLITPEKLLYDYPDFYNVEKVEDTLLRGKSCYLMFLKPTSDTDPTRYLQVWVDKDNYMTKQFKVEDLADNQTIFKLQNFRFDADLPDDTFTFNVPEGTEIIDIRE